MKPENHKLPTQPVIPEQTGTKDTLYKTPVIPAVSRDPDYQRSRLWKVWVPTYVGMTEFFWNRIIDLVRFKYSAARKKIPKSDSDVRRDDRDMNGMAEFAPVAGMTK